MPPLISVVMCTYGEMPHKLPVAVHSILGQTFQDFELHVWHDGTDNQSFADTDDFMGEVAPGCFSNEGTVDQGRLRFFVKPEQRGLTGFPMRQDSLEHIMGEFVCFTNGDNIHTPVFLEFFAREVLADPSLDFVYCNGLHDYAGAPWTVLDSQPRMGAIDMAFCMTRTSLAREIGFTADFSRGGDGTFIQSVASRGVNMKKVPGEAVTVVHC